MKAELERRIEEGSRLLSDEDPRVRLKAVTSLADIAVGLELKERERIVGLLADLAADKEPFIRWNVAYELGRIGHASGVKALGEKLAADEHANVRFRAALSLGLIGNEMAVQVLEKMCFDAYRIGEHAVVRAFAALALGRFRQEAAVRALSRLVDDEDPVVRWHVAVALGDIGLESGIEHLAKLTEDQVPFVRGHTAIALSQIGTSRGLPILEHVAEYTSKRAAEVGSAIEARMANVCAESLEALRKVLGRG